MRSKRQFQVMSRVAVAGLGLATLAIAAPAMADTYSFSCTGNQGAGVANLSKSSPVGVKEVDTYTGATGFSTSTTHTGLTNASGYVDSVGPYDFGASVTVVMREYDANGTQVASNTATCSITTPAPAPTPAPTPAPVVVPPRGTSGGSSSNNGAPLQRISGGTTPGGSSGLAASAFPAPSESPQMIVSQSPSAEATPLASPSPSSAATPIKKTSAKKTWLDYVPWVTSGIAALAILWLLFGLIGKRGGGDEAPVVPTDDAPVEPPVDEAAAAAPVAAAVVGAHVAESEAGLVPPDPVIPPDPVLPPDPVDEAPAPVASDDTAVLPPVSPEVAVPFADDPIPYAEEPALFDHPDA